MQPRRFPKQNQSLDPLSRFFPAIGFLFFSLFPYSLSQAAAPGCVGFASVDGDSSIGMLLTGGTVGGNGGTTVTVSTQAALETALGTTGPIVIQVSGMVTISPPGKTENLSSNSTLVGLGCGSGILDAHLVLDTISNVIVQNLVLGQSYIPGDPGGNCCNWDGLTIWHSTHHIWVDHCDISHTEDGLCDITDKANYVTVSWCKLHDQNKTSLVGSKDSATSDAAYLKVTYHHNWFDHLIQNAPRLRFGMAHVFNNFYTYVSGFCLWDTMAGQMVVENNNFGVSAINPFVIGTPTPTYQPLLSANGNLFDPTATGSQDTFGTAFDPATFYSYTADSAAAVPTLAVSGTGPCGYLATPTPTPSLPATAVWRINAGGPAYTDGAGQTWAADTQFQGGYLYFDSSVASVSGTADTALYQDEHYGDLFAANGFSYSFPVPPGFYQLTLKLAETDFTGTGQRAFNVSINGTRVLSNFDIYADAGGANKADDKVFDFIPASSGLITVQFSPGTADSPMVKALQLVPESVTPTPTPPAPMGNPYVYSNPSHGPTVRFVYNMEENGKALIKVWNASGQLAASLEDTKPPGEQQSQLDITSFAAGHYFYQVDLLYDSGREQRFDPRVLAVRK